MALDPCFCLVSSTPTPEQKDPCPPKRKCCIKACDGTVYGIDAVGPCGAVGQTDLTLLDHDISGCKDNFIFVLESWNSNFFQSVTVSPSGTLEWITGDADTAGSYSTVRVRLQCQSDCDDFVLNSVFEVHIFIKDNCIGVNCDEGDECNPCDGECDPIVPDVEIT